MGNIVFLHPRLLHGKTATRGPRGAYNGVMELIDSHCHIDFPDFDTDRGQVLARSRAAGIGRIVVPGVEARHWGRLLETCARHREVRLHPALGLHPLFMADHRPGHLDLLQREARRPGVVAIGEIGLDFFSPQADRHAQTALFEAQLAIAAQLGLPVLLHVRKAHEEVLRLLRASGVKGGIAHAFNSSMEQARRYIDLGFLLGFGGAVTHDRARRLRRLAADLPLEVLALETDAPDMAIASHRGERNSPEYLPEVVETLAALRPEPPGEIARVTSASVGKRLQLARPEPA